MASTTPVFGLRKPGYADRADVITDIAANMDLLDAHAHSGTYVRAGASGLNFNVKDFGAVGDGVADDTAAINAAIAAASNTSLNVGANGGVVYFPRGIYLVSTPIVVGSIAVRLVGAGAYSVLIKAASGFTGTDVIKFKQDIDAAINIAIGAEGFRVDCNNQDCHGITTYTAYDSIRFTDVTVTKAANDKSPWRFIPDPDMVLQVSQTFLLQNLIGVHNSSSATAPTFYFDKVQEAVLIGCKGWGGVDTANPAASVPFHFNDCRGIAMYGCSPVASTAEGIRVSTSTRFTDGVFIYGGTFETLGKVLVIAGTASFNVRKVVLGTFRPEGTVGGIEVDRADKCTIDSGSAPITISANCTQIHVITNDPAQVTDSGTETSVFGWNNQGSGTNQIRLMPRVAIASANTPSLQYRVPGVAAHWRHFWSASSGVDNGFKIARYTNESTNTEILVLQDDAIEAKVDLEVDADIVLSATAQATLEKTMRVGSLYQPGQNLYYYPQNLGTTIGTSNALGNGTLRLAPVFVDRTITVTRLFADISVVGEAGSVLRLGIYADNGNYPGALILDGGAVAGDSATVQEVTVSQVLAPGLYWVGGAVQSAPTTQPTVRVINNASPVGHTALPSANTPFVGYGQTGVTGALPANFSATRSVQTAVPRVGWKASA